MLQTGGWISGCHTATVLWCQEEYQVEPQCSLCWLHRRWNRWPEAGTSAMRPHLQRNSMYLSSLNCLSWQKTRGCLSEKRLMWQRNGITLWTIALICLFMHDCFHVHRFTQLYVHVFGHQCVYILVCVSCACVFLCIFMCTCLFVHPLCTSGWCLYVI